MYKFRVLSLSLSRNVSKQIAALTPRHTTSDGPFENVSICRTYMKRKTIKQPPSKPLDFDYSGDIEKSLKSLQKQDMKLGFENIKELEEAEESVKKLFSLEFGDGKDVLQKQIADITEKVKNHPADLRSLEYLITLQTVLIRNQMKHCLNFRKDKVAKSQLVERIQSRKKKLKELREKDYEKFTTLLEDLKIKYVPIDPYGWVKLGKRATRKVNAREAAMKLYQEKKEDLRRTLQVERQKFEDVKMLELSKIENQLLELGIEPQATLEETINMLKFGVAKVKPEPPKSRRQMLLEKKFEMKEASRKEQEAINYQKALYNL